MDVVNPLDRVTLTLEQHVVVPMAMDTTRAWSKGRISCHRSVVRGRAVLDRPFLHILCGFHIPHTLEEQAQKAY